MTRFLIGKRAIFSIAIASVMVLSCTKEVLKPGTLLWTYKFDDQLWAPLKYDNGHLYFGCDDMTFYAFNIATQQVKYKFVTDGIIRSAADITDEIVTFASDDGWLYALDVDSGKELWRFDLECSHIPRILPATTPPYEYDYLHSSPTYYDGHIYIGSANGILYAIDHKTGKEQWRFKTDQKIRSTPVVRNGMIYFGSWDGHFYALNAKSGIKVWQFDCGGIIQGSPAFGVGTIFVGSRSAQIFAIDAQTGEQKWTHIHKDGSWVESSPVYHDGVVYIGSSDVRALFAFNAENGHIVWEFKTDGWSWNTPAVTKGVVYSGGIRAYPYYFEGVDLKAGFYAVDQGSGVELWRITPEVVEGYISGGVFSTGAIANGFVYAGAIDGTLYALKE